MDGYGEGPFWGSECGSSLVNTVWKNSFKLSALLVGVAHNLDAQRSDGIPKFSVRQDLM